MNESQAPDCCAATTLLAFGPLSQYSTRCDLLSSDLKCPCIGLKNVVKKGDKSITSPSKAEAVPQYVIFYLRYSGIVLCT